jgi:uncharacterized protein Yka (UPF0111/DUF47 family)
LGKIMFKNILPALVIFGFVSVDVTSAFSQNLNDIENQESGADIMLDSEEDAGACEAWMEEKYGGEVTVGENIKEDGSSFYFAIGNGLSFAPTGDPNWVNSRRNSYTRAMLDLKKSMVEELELSIGRKITQEVAANSQLFSTQERETETKAKEKDTQQNSAGTTFTKEGVVNRTDNRGASSAYHKVMELLNRDLDKELKNSEPIPLSEDKEEAKEQVKELIQEVVGEENFLDAIKATAQAELVGVRRVYTIESALKGEKSSICVVAVYSDRTKNIAKGIGLRDPSFFPIGEPEPGVSINDLVPDRKTPDGMKELIATFGIDIQRDEEGNFVLISYGQSGAKSKKKRHIKIAKQKAETIAQGQMRTFIGEIAVVEKMQSSAESLQELADNSEVISNDEKFKQRIQSTSDTLKISGMKRLYNWAGRHPATKQIVAGSVLYLSSKTIAGALNRKRDLKDAHDSVKSGNKRSGSGSRSNRSQSGMKQRDYRGRAGRGTSKKDF